MEYIFHEKQEGYLCAQHCLNALLQDQYFNAVDLANLAEQLDTEERLAMAESGEDTDEYKRFIEQPSGNMDDSGYFSVQVISKALEVWNLELVPYTSTEPAAVLAQNDPSQMTAYICNYKGHWFTIRKIGNQWFNLNSMLSGPQLITDTHLHMCLKQLIQEGYSIFIVIGPLPPCDADEILLRNPVMRPKSSEQPKSSVKQPKENEQAVFNSKGYRLGTKAEEEAKILQAAQALESVMVPSTSRVVGRRPEVEIISESPRQPRERIIPIKVEGRDDVVQTIDDDDDDNAEFQKALQLSLENYEAEQQREKNLKLRLENPSTSTNNYDTAAATSGNPDEEDDDELRRALQLSLECVTAPPTPDREDVRWHRLAYLDRMHSRGPQAETSTKLNT